MALIRPALAVIATVCVLAACTSELDTATFDSNLGEFKLDRLVVIVDGPEQMPLSRESDDDTLKQALVAAVEPRFRRFDGDQLYTIGINLQAYSLAAPGVPVLISPKSLLAMSVNVYDDRPVRLNENPKRLVVTEDAGGDTVIGSGFSQTGDEQLAELAENAAIEIEKWLRENPQWFAPKPDESEGS